MPNDATKNPGPSTAEATIAPRSQGSPRILSKQQALKLAEKHEAAGRLKEAEIVLRSILKKHPEDPYATHLLGVVAHRANRPDLAIQLIRKSIELEPRSARFHANLCEMYRLKGNPEAALQHGKVAVELQPESHEALGNLGIVYYDLKDYPEAEKCQLKALELKPHYPPAGNNLGSIQRAQHDRNAAIETYRAVIQRNPDYVETLSNLGATLTEDEQPEQALGFLARAIRLNPAYAEAHGNLGVAYVALERIDDAFISFRRALELRPNYPEALRGLAGLSQYENHLLDAERLAKRAIELEPDNAAGHVLLGKIYKERGFPDRASKSFVTALTLDADLIGAHVAKGHLMMEIGDLEGAEACFHHALSLDGESLGARLALAQVRKVKKGDENMQALIKHSHELNEMHEIRAMSLHFALGKCFDDTGDSLKAFTHYLEACRLKRKRISYDPDRNTEFCDRIINYFSRERLQALAGAGDPSDTPIFVLGMPRSGTTLTEQILASHSDVFGAGELHDLLHISNHPFPEQERSQEGYPVSLGNLQRDQLTRMGARYLKGLRERAPEARRITDKMPANCFCIGLIHLMLPNAKIVHVRRNPVDTCVSQFTRLFNKSQFQSYDLAEVGRYYRDYDALMRHWRGVLPETAFYEVQYEDLVANTEPEARKLLEYCGLEWQEACLSFYDTERSIRTASVTQVRQPVYNSSVERWRKYEAFLGPLLEALGDLVPAK